MTILSIFPGSRIPPPGCFQPYLFETLNTQTILAGSTIVYTGTPLYYDVTASIPVGETVTVQATGTLDITGC